MPPRRRPEAKLENEILRRIGPDPDVEIVKLEVGSGFSRGCLDDLERALDGRTFALVRGILARWSVSWGEKGLPDLLVLVRGAPALLRELKSEDGRMREGQPEWHAAARRKGVDVEVWRSVEEALADVERARTAGRFVRGVYRAACAECHDTGVDASTGEGCGCKKKGRRA